MDQSIGISSVGTYVPASRLRREAITEVLGTAAGRGMRSVASHDEDTTSLAVSAARRAWAGGAQPSSLLFSTTLPAYADKTNATAVHAALGLDEGVPAFDLNGSVRSGIGVLRLALDRARFGESTLAVCADIRSGVPGGSDEAQGGDGAVAFVVGADDLLVELDSMASATTEFLDRWRLPTESTSRTWEERFGEGVYVSLAQTAVDDIWKQSGVTADDIDHLVISGLHERAIKRIPKAIGVRPDVATPTISAMIGNTGTAQFGLSLADTLERAEPGDLILTISVADGVDAFLWRATDRVAQFQASRPLTSTRVQSGTIDIDYATFLTWRNELRREPPRRPEPERTAAPPSLRAVSWKFAFSASRCVECGCRHLPPVRVCLACGSVDAMTPEPMANVAGTVRTFTIDRLAYSLSPPVVVAVIDFDGGGRIQCEMTDVSPDEVAVGDRVEMSFRRFGTVDGIHNYFWKARPLQEIDGGDT